MKTKNQTLLSENTLTSRPTDIIAGFPVRPGLFELNGATPLSNGVNFTAHTRHGTSFELLLFHSGEEEPFAVLPFPNACRIGDVYSMIVMGLDIEDLEYGYHVDGPYEPEKGHIFDKTKVLLDPYAKAVAGQREWGQQKIGSYHARVVRETFDWEDMPQSTRKISDLIIYELHVLWIYTGLLFRCYSPRNLRRPPGKDSLSERAGNQRCGAHADLRVR